MQRNVGNEGTVWSASVPDGSTNAWRLLFNATNMNPSNANNRGNGFLLRCLSAFIGFRLFRTGGTGAYSQDGRPRSVCRLRPAAEDAGKFSDPLIVLGRD
ncbi:hypothetical protein [uncultured Rikenella sp.]|uniref:hypothetical protein n=1 Tax=uncultured Rikenella sp. TaxID=368003 RepID=UPI00261A0E83|nr:hypothetical protein [uncultured Rikenella sp.]